MLTEEQIKDLKAGDSLQLDVVFSADVDHEILIKVPTTHGHWVSHVFSPVILSLPPAPPKHDPCRKFRKGDKVRVVERNGRYQPNIPVDELWSGLCTVAEDEDFCNNLVKVRSEDGREKLSHWWYLELVTPVEELEPYYVVENPTAWGVYIKKEKMGEVLASGYSKQFHPDPETEARAECARLNAEHRKEAQQ